jgi:hypothetical protein
MVIVKTASHVITDNKWGEAAKASDETNRKNATNDAAFTAVDMNAVTGVEAPW